MSFTSRCRQAQDDFSAAFVNAFEDPENKNPNLRRSPEPVCRLSGSRGSFRTIASPADAGTDAAFVHGPFESSQELVSEFARRAWRRPLQPNEVDGLMTLYTAARNSGASFEIAINNP